jgi:hypothetical protein
MVHKFQNVHQVRTGCNMVKSGKTNVPSTWLIFFCLCTHASQQNLPPFCFYHSCCLHYLPYYHSVCVQKALIYHLNVTIFMYVTRYHVVYSVFYYLQFHVTVVVECITCGYGHTTFLLQNLQNHSWGHKCMYNREIN